MRAGLPRILELLNEKANIDVRTAGEERGFYLYLANLSEWRLRFSERTPFIVAGEKDVAEQPDQVWAATLEVVREHGWQYRLPIVIVEGIDNHLRDRAALHRETDFPMAVLDDRTAQSMGEARSCRLPMLDALLTQLPRRNLLPYETAAPVTGSAFFDRQGQIDRLVRSDSSYGITGVRRIGKTSLLLQAKNLIEAKENCLLLICSTVHSQELFVREMVQALRPTELRHLDHHLLHFSDFLKRMPKYKNGRINLFLDEVDDLIELDRIAGYGILAALRAARTATNGGWRFIFAGATALERECYDRASPLFNMVQPMTLEAFSYREAEALICQPFEAIRVKIKNRTELVGRIYRETGGHPNLIQHYCILLADFVDLKERDCIEVGDLREVYDSRSFRDYVLRSFKFNTRSMEQLIIYLMARRDEFNQQDIDSALKTQGVTASFLEIDEACTNLEKVAVLRKVAQTYQYAQPLLGAMLAENYDLDYLVAKAKEELQR
jgi:hypothetical protein